MTENELISEINKLKKSDIKQVIDKRMNAFSQISRDFDSLFRELAFCILTAGTSAELGIKTIAHLGNTLFNGSQEDILKKLKEVYRFHTIRAGYIHEARESFRKLDINSPVIRDELVINVKGLGMKEASNFLRNVGF